MRARQDNQQRGVGEIRFMFGMYLAGMVGALVAGGVAKLVYDEVRQAWSDDTVPTIVAGCTAFLAYAAVTAGSMYGGGVTMRRLGMSGSLFPCCNKNRVDGATAPAAATFTTSTAAKDEVLVEPGSHRNPLANP
ncbi:MAG: hypothetical protein P1U40_01035 [Coxiellaceae bacterium]|nr:hypothetical protein [Coxiellaceae bacterium]